VTRYLLDTNILSLAAKPAPPSAILAWLEARRDEELHIASFTLAEIKRGILAKPAGKRRAALEAWFNGPEGPPSLFAGRVLPFDSRAALHWAALMAEGTAKGRPRSPLDMLIAATAQAHGCTIVTANDRDFHGLGAINPIG
jgi:toxin FitB